MIETSPAMPAPTPAPTATSAATSATMLADRAVIRLAGEDVRGFLQGLLTNDVTGALPVYAGLLTPQGKALWDFIVWHDDARDDALLIDCEADEAEALARKLRMYRVRRPLVIEVAPTLAVHWTRDGSGGWPDPRDVRLGRRWIAPPAAPVDGWHAHRLSLGIVEGARELGQDASLWLEANAEAQHGVSFTKGCYVGQENTARMHYRGKVNRRLAVVAAARPPDGARVHYPALGLAVVRTRTDGTA